MLFFLSVLVSKIIICNWQNDSEHESDDDGNSKKKYLARIGIETKFVGVVKTGIIYSARIP